MAMNRETGQSVTPAAKYLNSLKSPKVAGFQWQEPDDDKDRRLFRDVLECGCHIVAIEDSPHAPEFCFSIGFFINLQHPEFFVMGMSSNTAGRIINRLFRSVEGGHRFSEDEKIADLFDDERLGILKPFPKSLYFDYLGYACWFYRSLTFFPPPLEPKFPVLQLFWPDKAGRYPFEAGCHPSAVAAQVPRKMSQGRQVSVCWCLNNRSSQMH